MGEAAKRLSWDDCQAFPDDGLRRQILDGEVEVSPSPSYSHQRLVAELNRLLRSHCLEHELGEVLPAPLGVTLPNGDVVEPDLLFLATGGLAKVEDDRIVGPPDLVVEVLSPSNRRTDLLKKRRIYEASGGLEYWIVDPEAERVTRLAREGEAFGAATVGFAEPGGAIVTTLFPGFRLDVAALFGVQPA